MTKKPRRVYKAPALEKGLEIIELLATQQAAMSMSEITASLGRSRSEIFRMLSVLEQKGYLSRQGNGDKYGITNHLFDLGMRVPPNSTLIEVLLPKMRALATEIRQSCHLSVVSGNHIVVIARVENPAPVGFSVRVGTSRGLAESAAGKIFLAWMPAAQQLQVLRQLTKVSRKNTDSKSPAAELATIRDEGFAATPSQFIDGITDICLPVFQRDNDKVIAALTVPYAAGSENQFALDETVDIVRLSVASMSADASVFDGF